MQQGLDLSPIAGCLATANECLPAHEAGTGGNYPSICEGKHISFCNAGRIDQVDCISLGFDGCDADTGLCAPRPTYDETR